jgi:hypothetical protein
MTHNTPSDTSHTDSDTYEHRIACRTCGVVGSVTLYKEDTRGDIPTQHDPAKLHYERTGHETKRVNYTTAPDDIQTMLDQGDPSDLQWHRIAKWIATNENTPSTSP